MVTPLSLVNLNNPPTAEEWNDALISIQNTLGLPTTTWQPGGVERTIDASVANVQQQSDVAASIMVQAGFLDFAANGYVTYTDATGAVITVFVTPDPSDPAQNPTGALGWLDVLADSVYNVQRILQAPAGGQLAIVNASVNTYGPYEAGTYHVAQSTGPTYSNVASLTISPSTSLGAISSVADDGSGGIEVIVGSTAGLSDGDAVALVGVTGIPPLVGTTAWTITVTSVTSFTLDGAVYAGAWTGGGTVYIPTLAECSADASGTASDAAQNTVQVAVTSLSGVTVANIDAWEGADTESNDALAARCKLKLAALAVGQPGGALAYYAITSYVLAPQLSPPQRLSTPITRALVSLDTTTGTVYVTIANAAGAPGSPDVSVVQAVEDAYAGITANTVVVRGAANHAIANVLTIYLPAAYNTAANKTYFSNAVRGYYRALPIGGVTNTGGTSPNTNVVPYDAVLGSVWEAAQLAGIPVQQVEGTIAGGTSNVQLALTPVPEVATDTVTINMVSV
jgi:hypothetical protein